MSDFHELVLWTISGRMHKAGTEDRWRSEKRTVVIAAPPTLTAIDVAEVAEAALLHNWSHTPHQVTVESIAKTDFAPVKAWL
jgi:hypothetical protein